MKKELFNELQKSMEQALAHSQGKITLRTKQVPVPKKVTALAPREIRKLRERLGTSQAVFARLLNVSTTTEIKWEHEQIPAANAGAWLVQLRSKGRPLHRPGECLWQVRAKSSPRKVQLHSAGYFTIILGALGTFPAVLSGLFMTKGVVLGHDALLFHHLFVWPAFAGLVGLGVWRALMNDQASPRSFAAYLVVLFLTAGLMAGAGYWGGELILNS